MSALSRSLDRLHSGTDRAAAAAGWTVTRTGWGGRSYGWTWAAAGTGAADVTGSAVVVDLDAFRTNRSGRLTSTGATGSTGSTGPTFGGAA